MLKSTKLFRFSKGTLMAVISLKSAVFFNLYLNRLSMIRLSPSLNNYNMNFYLWLGEPIGFLLKTDFTYSSSSLKSLYFVIYIPSTFTLPLRSHYSYISSTLFSSHLLSFMYIS